MIERQQADRALNQLASLVGGRDLAIATNHLTGTPVERIEAMRIMVLEAAAKPTRMRTASEIARDDRSMTTKLDSLGSLRTLADLVGEVEWDEQPQLEEAYR